jgi:sigma-E factor negative regulatory protein RseC
LIEQQGQVVKIVAGRGFVRVGSRSGCTACDSGKGCGAGIFSRLIPRRAMTIETDIPEEIRVGQSVILGLAESVFLSLLLRLYLIPFISGLAGAVFGHYISSGAGNDLVIDLGTLAGAIAGAGIAIAWLRSGREEFSGEVAVYFLRVVGRGEESACPAS